MTIKEFIEKLEKVNPDAEVSFISGHDRDNQMGLLSIKTDRYDDELVIIHIGWK